MAGDNKFLSLKKSEVEFLKKKNRNFHDIQIIKSYMKLNAEKLEEDIPKANRTSNPINLLATKKSSY